MATQSLTNTNRALLDANFIQQYSAFEKELPQVVQRAARATNMWLRTVVKAELGYELKISSKALQSRFRTYKNGRISKLWIGLNDIAVHRIGMPVQNSQGVQVGSRFYEGAFISPMDSGELLVWRRKSSARSDIKLVKEDISQDVEHILDFYLPEINRKFQEFFSREFTTVLSKAA